MTNATLNIQNLLTTSLSLDIEFGAKRNLRRKLAPFGTTGDTIDVGDLTTLSELNSNPQFRALLDASSPKVRIKDIVRGSNDVLGADTGVVIDASGMADTHPRLIVTVAAGAAGARDVLVYNANFPFAGLLVDAQMLVQTAVALSTVQARDAAAGAGNALTAAMSSAVATRVRDPGTGQTVGNGIPPTIAKGSSLYLRMTDGDAAVRFIMDFIRTS